jgi:nucleoside-diphosphate-sugar epimerase
MGKTLLITGATGYLGSHLAHRFVADGHVVGIIKRTTSSLVRIADILDKIRVFDVERLHESFEALDQIDAVIHTATNYGRRGEQASSVLDANTAFPLRLLEAAMRHDVKLFINTDTVLDPALNAYTLSKHQFKEWGHRFARNDQIRFTNLRLEHVFGAGDDPEKFTTHVVRTCICNAPELKLTKGEQMRDFVYIDDVVDAYAIVLERLSEPETSFIELDVGSGRAVSIREFVETVHRLTGATTRLEVGALSYRENEKMLSQASTAELNALGWKCRHDLVSGLSKMISGERRFLGVGTPLRKDS